MRRKWRKSGTAAKNSFIRNGIREHEMFFPIISRSKYSTKTKRATTNPFSANDLR